MDATPVAKDAPKQVISISPEGVMQSLRRKKGQGLDLRQFGTAEVKRVSEIIFDDAAQKFYVQFLEGALAGRKLTYTLYTAVTEKTTRFINSQPVMLFDEYEDAVAAEVEVLDTMTARGLSFQAPVLQQLSPAGETAC